MTIAVTIYSLLLHYCSLMHFANWALPSHTRAPSCAGALHLAIDFTSLISVALLVWSSFHDSFQFIPFHAAPVAFPQIGCAASFKTSLRGFTADEEIVSCLSGRHALVYCMVEEHGHFCRAQSWIFISR
ncbi:hypothetical protein ACJRO7_012667 [Eucalyptus globulus]|uniref:Uncharacterized protein n=1 Tax=Eucalyptus globulus TaxID=34317 RepID=A0ABD3LJF9_EUCGL